MSAAGACICAGLVLWCSAVMMTVVDAADFCLSDADCDYHHSSSYRPGRQFRGRARTCVRLYDGCVVGQCMCRSRYPSTLDSHGRCVDSKNRCLMQSRILNIGLLRISTCRRQHFLLPSPFLIIPPSSLPFQFLSNPSLSLFYPLHFSYKQARGPGKEHL